MRKGWELRKLGEVCELINRGISPKYTENKGLLVLNQKCIRNHKVSYEFARLHDDKSKKVAEERYVKLGDVLVNSTGTGTLGRVAQVKESIISTVDSHVTIVRPNRGLFYEDFFGYAMINIEEEIAKGGEGCGGQTELSRSKLRDDYYISYPTSIPDQKRIVAILDKTFAAIDFAKANVEKNLQNARDLFESYMEHAFANLEEDWEEKKLRDVCELISGQHIDAKDYNFESKGVGYLTGPSDFGEINPIITRWTEKPKVKAHSGDILITVKGSGVGKINLLDKNEIAISRQLMAIRAKKVSINFLYRILSLKVQHFKDLATGAAIPGISRDQVLDITFFLPPEVEQERIIEKIEILSSYTRKLSTIYKQKLEDLDELKKAILQKAFTGELVYD